MAGLYVSSSLSIGAPGILVDYAIGGFIAGTGEGCCNILMCQG